MRRGVIYARYSSHNQREESIEQQVEECTAYCQANGIEVLRVYADKAVSGKTDRRVQFQRMMRDAERKDFDVVVAYKSNRIARNMLNALGTEAKLNSVGVSILYAKEEFGDTAAGRFALRTMLNVNQFYSENMAEDIKRGLRSNAEAFKVNGHLPYGYRKSDDSRYEIAPAQADVVREIFMRVARGDQYCDIAADLNGRGFRTSQGNLWNKSSFVRMLRNRAYIGEYHHSGVVAQGAIPAIIDEDTFLAAQERLQARKPYGRGYDYILTGKLFCGHCNAPMVGVSGTSRNGEVHHYYACQGRRAGRCEKQNERKDELEYAVAKLTRDVVLTDEFIEWIADEALKLQARLSEKSGLAQMRAQRAESHRSLTNLITAIERGVDSVSLKGRIAELESEIADLGEKIARAERVSRIELDKDRLIYAMELFRDEDISAKKYQKALIQNFVKSVKVYDDKLEVEYFNSDSTTGECSYSVESAPPYAFCTNIASVAVTPLSFVLTLKKRP